MCEFELSRTKCGYGFLKNWSHCTFNLLATMFNIHWYLKRCKCIHGLSSILDPHTNQRIITVQSIQTNDYVYFSGELVYSGQLFTMFSNSLIHAHTTFEGFAESYVSTLIDLHAQQTPKYSGNTFAKRLEVV